MAPLRTPLYDWHVFRNARMIEFSGWEMPLQYTGIVEEHGAVRGAVGLFDVSHMGKLLVSGSRTRTALNRLSTNSLPTTPGRARYTHLPDDRGRIIDDVIVTCLEPDRFLIVCNAGPRPRVAAWIEAHLDGQEFHDRTEDFLCLALQGPRAAEALSRITRDDVRGLKPFRADHIRFEPGRHPRPAQSAPASEMMGWGPPPPTLVPVPGSSAGSADVPVLVTRTGYTGEDGFELFPPRALGEPVWSALLMAGEDLGIRPVGLGARDTLRLEKGDLLSGQDFTGRETSLETNSEGLVDWDHEFIGREALQAQKTQGGYRRFLGLRFLDRGVPRPGCLVLADEGEVGRVTSGTMSPSLRVGIALAYLDPTVAVPGTEVTVEVRGERKRAVVVEPPFL
ncbi:MAG TPA: glycine cleavage system aminomethyltransferase GcvT [Thermoplasmata archaeon]|nr:glycine cleavage system aminomethyltransferase GcvT [Thermoplasmata archaeon]